MKPIRYFSMFSGIGGFELGIQRALPDAECVGYSEIDKYAISVYKGKFKGHKNYGDATTINPRQLPDFELLCGGFPCQAFSIAGKRRGFEDTRGTLFFDIARICAYKKPRYLVLENVKGLLNHQQGITFTEILRVLADLGYSVEWCVLNSKNFGVPQNRERIYIIGHLGNGSIRQVFPITSTDKAYSAKLSSTTIDSNYFKGIDNHGQRTGIIVSGVLDTPGWRRHHEQNRRVHDPKGIAPTLPTGTGGGHITKIEVLEATKKGYAEAYEGDSINLKAPHSKTRRGRVGKQIANTLETGGVYATVQRGRVRRLTPVECERLQGFPDNWTAQDYEGNPLSDTQRYKMCGNAVTTNVVEAVMKKVIDTLNIKV